MGRYYYGDIEGKFWLGIQSSTDADFFGRTHTIYYDFVGEDLKDIEDGVRACEQELGGYRQKLDAFFEANAGYTNEKLGVYLGIAKEPDAVFDAEISRLLTWYARLRLGEQILTCVKTTGRCSFDAEV